ncbi:RING-H2 finger protein ATL13 [Acorus gramineus]|uniref:RING-type E3 ubiquitin transferase n=1 Tax=Acorus gramineus TaxID=55184 RepID=A0AAV9BG48_ACOGR|nr:RING-H2 finger protein ATL13 [Acorus gramineus]
MESFVIKTNNTNNPNSPQILQPPPPPPQTITIENKISPSILLIILILAVIFFISGLLHLLVRYLLRPTNRDPEEIDNVTALQGQLQQLFHLHDAGVDQSFIDTLPVFLYKAIIGLKDPFDCAVCLCEFEADDKLRLLPKCSHAFHIECIDTWLLSHSTCPLCRGSLLPDIVSPNNGFSPVVLVLESGSESSREIVPDPVLPAPCEDELGSSRIEKGGDFTAKDEEVVRVKLGKFRNVDPVVEGTSADGAAEGGLDERRCFSMGSFEYVMDETSRLQVAIKPPAKRPNVKRPPPMPGRRLAMSECDGNSSRFNGLGKKESFSVSKIWHRSRKDKAATPSDCSRRSFSFRIPFRGAAAEAEEEEAKPNKSSTSRAASEFDTESCYSADSSSQVNSTPPSSLARRTLLWVVGRPQSRVVHSSGAAAVGGAPPPPPIAHV